MVMAALMELSYFSDTDTKFTEQYTGGGEKVEYEKPPFDFTYLTGTKNGESEFKLSELREAMAQNIFLDMTSEFAPHKRSIRDNIKKSWTVPDDVEKGRSYPKQFMSFGLSTIEIPINLIRANLANRLAQDLVGWWRNESANRPPEMLKLVREDILKEMKLTERELISELTSTEEHPIAASIAEWLNKTRKEIDNKKLLKCTLQGLKLVGKETGNILELTGYLQKRWGNFQADNLKEISDNEMSHGEYFKSMYRRRDDIIAGGCDSLEKELYCILEDRNRGIKFAQEFLNIVEEEFESNADKFRRDKKSYSEDENSRKEEYQKVIEDINELKEQFAATKEADMKKRRDAALNAIDGSANAAIRRKARTLGLKVIARLREHIQLLRIRLSNFERQTKQLQDYFASKSEEDANKADALQINGIKLYDREELNSLYDDLIKQLAGVTRGSKTPYEQGMDSICSVISQDILKKASPLWKSNRHADEVMRLFDLTKILNAKQKEVKEIIYKRAEEVIKEAPDESILERELTACDRLFKIFNSEAEIRDRIQLAYQKSQPLMLLNRGMLSQAKIEPEINSNVAIIGGSESPNPAAQGMLPMIRQFVPETGDIKPLGKNERHRIIFVQEMGGFSLRCIQGIEVLRQSYRKWLGEGH